MPRIHGHDAFFALTDATGACQTIHSDGNEIVLTYNQDNPEQTAFGMNNISRAASGLGDARMTYAGWAQHAANSNLLLLAGSALRGKITLITFGPGGSTSGCPKYTACMLIEDSEVSTPVKGIVTIRASFSLGSGSVSDGVFA